MDELTPRQINLLKTIIEEYMESAEPVGSEKIEKKYELGVSPATIRNEMAVLTKADFLKQPHTSSGRIPTKKAIKLYVARLMEEKQLSVSEEVAAKEKVWDARGDFQRLLKEATRALAEQTRFLAVAGTENGDTYHSGYSYLLDLPEFFDIDVTKTIFSMLDRNQTLIELFQKAFGEGPVHYLLGDELGFDYLEPCGMVFTRFQAGPQSGSIGVIGPSRLNYSRVVPTVKHFGHLLEELLGGV